MVEDRDVPAGLVCGVDLVALLNEAPHGGAHADHVIVGMRAEDEHLLAGRPARGPAGDGVHHPVEDLEVDFVGAAALLCEVVQVVLPVILVGQFEDGLPEREGEPDDGPARQGVVPFAWSDQPRRGDARQHGGRGVGEIERSVRMLLEAARGYLQGHRFFDGAADDSALVFPEREEADGACLHYRADAHGDRLAGHVFEAEEVAGCVRPGHAVEVDQPRSRAARRARFVEPDVPGPADAEYLEVDAAGAGDCVLVFAAEGLDIPFGNGAIRNVYVLARDVHVVEKVLEHPAVVALRRVGRHRPVFVEVERDDVRQVEPVLLVQPDQFAVNVDGRMTGGQAEDRVLAFLRFFADEVGDAAGDALRRRGRCLKYRDGNSLGVRHGAPPYAHCNQRTISGYRVLLALQQNDGLFYLNRATTP